MLASRVWIRIFSKRHNTFLLSLADGLAAALQGIFFAQKMKWKKDFVHIVNRGQQEQSEEQRKMANEYITKTRAIEICGEWCPDDDGSVSKTCDLRDMLDEIENADSDELVRVSYNRWKEYKKTNPCTAYVKKADVVNICTEWCPDDDGSVGRTDDMRNMLDEIENLPEEMVIPITRSANLEQD